MSAIRGLLYRVAVSAVALAMLSAPASAASRVDLSHLERRNVAVPHLGSLTYYIHKTPGLVPGARAPVLVLLHGLGSQPHSWIVNGGVLKQIDEAVRRGKLPKCWVVLPEGRAGYWSDWADGKHPWGSWIHGHLLRDLDKLGRRARDPRWTAVVGISMGGFGALSLALNHPNSFGFAAGLSATDLDIATKKPPFRPVYRSVLGRHIDTKRMRAVNPYQLVQAGAGSKAQRFLVAWGSREPAKFSAGSERLVKAMRAKRLNPGVMIVHHGVHGWKTTWLVAQPWWIRELGTWWRAPAHSR